jgi:hypothetical protein
MLYSRHPKRTIVVVFPILTANDGSTGPFLLRLSFASGSSMSYLAIWHYPSAMLFDGEEKRILTA